MRTNTYRTHTCGELRPSHTGQTVRLSGWVHRKRDHGGILFIDLRDHYGLTQIVITPDRSFFEQAQSLRQESVIQFTGEVLLRASENVNPKMATGAIELQACSLEILSLSDPLPMPVADDIPTPESTRLTYRFLDLRRESLHRNLVLRSDVIFSLRKRMVALGFREYSTPILTSSSPEGARDYLVPSRIHPGKFYALPQAPQQFKQLLMVSGFDRYFQIAPCFRDEDARADRSPGEFYQLDIEMSFAEQEDVFAVVEEILQGLFEEFGKRPSSAPPFPRFPYETALIKYGTDKPDLRASLEIVDVTEIFRGSDFKPFREVIENGGVVRAIPCPGLLGRPRSWFDKLTEDAKALGAQGLAYLIIQENGALKGPMAKAVNEGMINAMKARMTLQPGGGIFFLADKKKVVQEIAGTLRVRLSQDLGLFDKDPFRFCWIVDFPMYELDEETKQIVFSHNPFSMPQGGLHALSNVPPLDIKAYQYDIVCNGIELSSGAVRNHRPDIMYKAFEIAGYAQDEVDSRFGGMIRAFKFGAPPHAGIAPGLDRIVMLLADEPNIREVIAFPMNQKAQDLLMNAPNTVSEKQLKELHIALDLPNEEEGHEKLVP